MSLPGQKVVFKITYLQEITLTLLKFLTLKTLTLIGQGEDSLCYLFEIEKVDHKRYGQDCGYDKK